VAGTGGEPLMLRVVAYAITAVWATSLLLDMAIRAYSPNPGVHPPMLLVAGYLFTRRPGKDRETDDN
jgi:hypothetical protein